MRVLIVGGSGQIGRHLVRDLSAMIGTNGQVIATYHRHPVADGVQLDIADGEQLTALIQAARPDTIIWLAGSKDVSRLERDPAFSTTVNEAPVAQLVDILQAMPKPPRLIYLSSDYVYCGQHGQYRDGDNRQPGTVYGRSKLVAEDMILGAGLDALVLRTSAVMSSHAGFLAWLLEELNAGREVSLFGNATFSPTPPIYLSRALHFLLDAGISESALNFAGPAVTRYEMGRRTCEAFGIPGALVRETATDFSSGTFRPNLSLVTSAILAHIAPSGLTDFTPESCA